MSPEFYFGKRPPWKAVFVFAPHLYPETLMLQVSGQGRGAERTLISKYGTIK